MGMKIMDFIEWVFAGKPPVENSNLPKGSKDPKDYLKDSLSTHWDSDNTHCTTCKKSTGHNDFMSDICPHCGSFNTQVRFGRSFRKIYMDDIWQFQIRYRNGDEEIRKDWY